MSFVKNLGFVDQVVRALIILDVLAAYLMDSVSGFWAFLLLSLAVMLVASCLLAFCPLYAFLGLSTRQRDYESRRF